MPSSSWLLRVVAAQSSARWDVVQARTGWILDAAPSQDLAVQRALERLSTGGAVEVVVDGFMVRRQVVMPPPVPRRTVVIDLALWLGMGAVAALLLDSLLHASTLMTTLGAIAAANAVRQVRRAVLARRSVRLDPGSAGPATAPFLAERGARG